MTDQTVFIAILTGKMAGNTITAFGTEAEMQAHADHNSDNFDAVVRPAKSEEVHLRIGYVKAEIAHFNHKYTCLGWGDASRLRHALGPLDRELYQVLLPAAAQLASAPHAVAAE